MSSHREGLLLPVLHQLVCTHCCTNIWFWYWFIYSEFVCIYCWLYFSDQKMVIFPENRNRNRFAELTSVRIGIGIICEFQNLQIGIGIIFVRWEVFANNSQIPDIYFFSKKFLFLDSYIFFIRKIYRANKAIVRYMHTLYIYSI